MALLRRVKPFIWRVGSRLAKQLIGVIRALCASADAEHLDRLAELSPLGIRLELHQIRPAQTDSQRGYFHAVLPACADEAGMSPDELKHEIKRIAFGEQEVETPFGKRMRVPSSKKADRDDYAKMTDTLIRTMAEMFSYSVPPPKER